MLALVLVALQHLNFSLFKNIIVDHINKSVINKTFQKKFITQKFLKQNLTFPYFIYIHNTAKFYTVSSTKFFLFINKKEIFFAYPPSSRHTFSISKNLQISLSKTSSLFKLLSSKKKKIPYSFSISKNFFQNQFVESLLTPIFSVSYKREIFCYC